MSVDGWIGSQESPKGGIDWSKVRELLRVGQYERVSKILHEAKVAQEEIEGAIPSHVLSVAFRICLACRQCQEEVEWHRGAHQEAIQRESELKQQLYNILDLLSESGVSMSPGGQEGSHSAHTVEMTLSEDYLSEPSERQSLWQRVKALLGWGIDSRTHEGQTLSSSVEVGSTLPTENVEGIADRSPVEEEAPTGHLADDIDELTSDPPETPAPPLSVAEHHGSRVSKFGGKEPGEPDSPSLIVYCLGPFRVYQDEELITEWPSYIGKSIFKYLITHRDRPISKDRLMDLFWQDADPESARNSLNVAIYGLRKALRAIRSDFSHVLFQDGQYLLNPVMPIWVDSEEFSRHIKTGKEYEWAGEAIKAKKEYEIAEGLYSGEFLEEDVFEDWTMGQRRKLKESYLYILDRLSRHYIEEKQYATCIHLSQKILLEDSCREDAHRRLMRCYFHQDQPYLAVRQYHLCKENLKNELDMFPTSDTKELYELIRKHNRG